MKLAEDFQTGNLDNRRTDRRTVLLFSLLVALLLSATGYVDRAMAEVPSVVSLSDVNGNGSSEVSVLMRTINDKNYAYVMDGAYSAQVKRLEFDAALTPLFQAIVPDIDGNAVDEVAMLGVGPDGYVKLQIKDADTGVLINSFMFDKNFPPVAMVVVPDIDGNAISEIAVLGVGSTGGYVKVFIKDASSGTLLNSVSFDRNFPPVAVLVVPDIDGSGADEIAVLGVRASDGYVKLQIKDADTGVLINSFMFDKNFPPVAMVVVPDMNSNGSDELAVLGVRASDGEVKVSVKDADSGDLITGISFDKNFPPVGMSVVPDIDGSGADEIAVLGVRVSDGNVQVAIKDTSTGALINNVSFGKNYPPVGMMVAPDIDGNGVSEIALLGANLLNGRGKVVIKDASTGTVIENFFLPSYVVVPSDRIIRVSVASDGTPSESLVSSGYYYPSISSDGRYVAFNSYASNIAPTYNVNTIDIYLHDTQTGATTLVSAASDGTQANGSSYSASISSDGRYVAFDSYASNLAGDTNGRYDIFLHDTQTGATTLVSVASDGTQGNGNSTCSSISSDGRYVAFGSGATNLVAGDTNGVSDIFMHDTQTGQTTLVSVASDGTQSNGDSGPDYCSSSFSPSSISSDGRYVAFWSEASNLVVDDTNGVSDIFLHDTQTGVTTLVSVASDGTQGNSYSLGASISDDGRYVAFDSYASNLVAGDTNGYYDVFLHDTQTGATTRVSVASDGTQSDRYSLSPSISPDGRYVAFASLAYNLVTISGSRHYNIYLHDTQTGVTELVSVASDGSEGRGSYYPSISDDGQYVAFTSWANRLVPGDAGSVQDVFRVVNPLYTAP